MDEDILLVEDEVEFADYLRRGLGYVGYRVRLVHSAEEGLDILAKSQPDFVILDVMLPGMDGITACRCARESGYAGPLLMLTARNAISDRVSGLDAGADDYLVKPFAFEELLARLRRLQRRTREGSPTVAFSDLELDKNLHQARRAGRSIDLTKTEYDLLIFLLKSPQRVLSRDVLITELWGMDSQIAANVLDVYISRLRRKIGPPPLIHTLHGVGYIMKEENL